MDVLNLPVWEAAPGLLGWRVCRRLGEQVWKLTVVETEAYASVADGASHAWRGPTPRNQPMFGPVGRSYVYFIYGMYHCLNVVAHAPNEAGAVLIRALDHPQCNGPGKLCRFLQIDRELSDRDLLGAVDNKQDFGAVATSGPSKQTLQNGETEANCQQLLDPQELWLEPGLPNGPIEQGLRVGIRKSAELPWRFWIGGNRNVSRGPVKPPRV
jgi:DNA-3-methyladenine glycosylase